MAAKRDTFTGQIRRLIEESGQSRYAICKACGIDQALMSRFMAGDSTFSMPTLDKLADHLGWRVVAVEKKQRTPKAE